MAESRRKPCTENAISVSASKGCAATACREGGAETDAADNGSCPEIVKIPVPSIMHFARLRFGIIVSAPLRRKRLVLSRRLCVSAGRHAGCLGRRKCCVDRLSVGQLTLTLAATGHS